MKNDLKNRSIWGQLKSGFDYPKKAYWYEIISGILAYPAVSLGLEHTNWLGIEKELILYRDENNECHIEWTRKSNLLFRYLEYERKHGTRS
jgi:hypothetical protein